jgi:type I restriction enzyme S subunit
MSGWKQIQFAEIGETIRGVSYKPSDLREEPSEAAVTLLRSNNIKGGRLNYRDTQFVIKGVVRENQLLKPQDIALCMSNGNRALVGKAGQFEGRSDSLEYTVGAFCSIFRPNQSFDPNFVRHLFGSEGYQRHLDVILAGSAINNLKGSDIQEIVADCPTSKPEQTKIAEILSTVDRAIEQAEALIAKQQRLKTGLMQDLLTRGIDEHGNLRSEQTHEFKDSTLGRIPVEWEVFTLNQVVDELITYGIVQAGPHIEDGVPYIRTGDMSGDSIEVDRLLRTSSKLAKAYKRSEVREGDIVFALRATVGKVLPVDASLHGANLTQGTAKISPKNGIAPAYLIQALRTSKVQDQIRLCEKGTTFMEITLTDLRQIVVAMPKQESEQQAIAEALDANDATATKYSKSLHKLRSLKTALMQDLLTGRKRVMNLLAE